MSPAGNKNDFIMEERPFLQKRQGPDRAVWPNTVRGTTGTGSRCRYGCKNHATVLSATTRKHVVVTEPLHADDTLHILFQFTEPPWPERNADRNFGKIFWFALPLMIDHRRHGDPAVPALSTWRHVGGANSYVPQGVHPPAPVATSWPILLGQLTAFARSLISFRLNTRQDTIAPLGLTIPQSLLLLADEVIQ